MYTTEPNLVLGFHGCDASLAKRVVGSPGVVLKPSRNNYDWLGNGIYFWDNNPARALEYSRFIKKNPGRNKRPIQSPAVVGAVIDLGFCLNLLESDSLKILKESYRMLRESHHKSGTPMPENLPGDGNQNELLLRKLDCAVIELTHAYNEMTGQRSYDSVRGVFVEGGQLYENSGFNEKNHIQICVRNPNCIKGFFYPRKPASGFHIP